MSHHERLDIRKSFDWDDEEHGKRGLIPKVSRKSAIYTAVTIVTIVLCVAAVLLILSIIIQTQWGGPGIIALRLNEERPIFTRNSSTFFHNSGAAYIPVEDKSMTVLALTVRNINSSIYDTKPASIAITRSKDKTGLIFESISDKDVVLKPDQAFDVNGAEDPRVTLIGDMGNDSRICLATCSNTKEATPWEKKGIILDVQARGGALLPQDDKDSLLFYGDRKILVATTKDFVTFTPTDTVLLEPRANKFDSELVQPGPTPMKMSDGNYLFLYNSAKIVEDLKTPKPGLPIQYNIGYAILDGKDPTKVLKRSDNPILSPDIEQWEGCIHEEDQGLNPNKVYVLGMKQIEKDKFEIYYSGCDSHIGVAEVRITW